jgi:hypothetical protein
VPKKSVCVKERLMPRLRELPTENAIIYCSNSKKWPSEAVGL